MIITIDGPAGSGKSTLSIALAKKLNFFCLNGGYLYRGLAYVLKTFYKYSDEKLQNPNLQDVHIVFDSGLFRYDYLDGFTLLFFQNHDITPLLKKVEIGKAAAIIAQNEAVRKIIRGYERAIVQGRDAVVEGRAYGSSTFFDADVKLYVTASLDVRAQRAIEDQAYRGNTLTPTQALDHIVSRDAVDMNRKHDPLIIPIGAILLDTSNLSQQEVVDKAVGFINEEIKKKD